MNYRIERDTLGEVLVPSEVYWGAQTQRSLNNFRIGSERIPLEIVYAYAYIKKAAAFANHDLSAFPLNKRAAIAQVCDEILSGELDNQFPLVVWQTGSGTQTNMNVNEVIANRAHVLQGGQLNDQKKILHPNDDVNKSQSSNDTFPTAMHLAAYQALQKNLLPIIEQLYVTLQQKSEQWQDIVKIGRTHWMDATPLSLGQEFSGYAAQVNHAFTNIKQTMNDLLPLALGGTAVGTGINTPKGFAEKVISYIVEYTGYHFEPNKNKFAGMAAHDAIVAISGTLRQLAVALMKIANDIRVLASGPRSGIGEISIPANEPGSSIMPGKVNPTQVEAITMVCAQVIGNDTAITIGGMNGHFELNVYKPMMIYNLLQSIQLLSNAGQSFHDHLVKDIEPNHARISEHLNNSLMLVTALNPHIGYENAAAIAKKAFAENITLKQAGIALGLISAEQYDSWVNPKEMIGSE